MTILYVHGLGGGNGGRMEEALRAAAAEAGHRLRPLRWPTGELAEMVTATASDVALEVLTERNPWRAVMRVILALERRERHHWDEGLVAITSATLRAAASLKALGRCGEDFSAIAFSLGCRVLLLGLRSVKEPPPRLRRVVFAGAASSRSAFKALPARLVRDGRVVNVYSTEDGVLKWLYEEVQQSGDPAGLGPVEIEGVRNVCVETGHLSYPGLAKELLELATV